LYRSLYRTLVGHKRYLLRQREYIQPDAYAEPIYGFTKKQGAHSSQRALIVYLPQALYEQPQLVLHTNIAIVQTFAEALAERGYVIDVIDWSNPKFELYEPYDLIFSLGSANTRILERVAYLAPTIYFATRHHLPIQRMEYHRRAEALYRRRGTYLLRRYPHKQMSELPNAAALIVQGNEVTAATYRSLGIPMYLTDNFALPVQTPALDLKAFSEARRHFLWLGSSPLLHKGLDLLLEAFAQMPDLHLWICGPITSEHEHEFVQIYKHELYHTPNIHTLGWMNVLDGKFAEVANRCCFLIFPSCSEGQAGGVLDSMALGLIPIVTRETGIHTDNFGVTLPDAERGTIQRVAREMSELEPEQCRAMALSAHQTAKQRYTAENFRSRVAAIFDQVLPSLNANAPKTFQ